MESGGGGGGNVRSPADRAADRLMDEHLRSLGLQRKKIAKDGSCLFRAVAEQVLHCQSRHLEVRHKCVEFLRKNRKSYEAFIEGDFEEYLHKLQDPQQWVGEVEINALAMMYKRDFWIFQEPGKPAVNITANGFHDKVQLCFLNGNHYDSIYPLSRVKNTAVCQSILYELLYERVFGVDRAHMDRLCHRASKPSDLLIDDAMPPCPSSDDSDAETDARRQENGTCAAALKSKGRGRGRSLSERVKRSLNPTLLRNVQYDVWTRSKKAQQKMDFCIASGMQYNVGDRCQVLESSGQMVGATVRKLPLDHSGDLVTVYTEDQRELSVPVWKLRAPPETTWSTVVREKRVTNGAGEWEHRGRGRGTKASSAPPGAAQGTAPPAGRGPKQQQHSTWTQAQPPLEEREAPSSKSEPVSFGLTLEQRLAKEEEERNAALVELQFPDDRSFPALGAQTGGPSDGGRKRGGGGGGGGGGEKRRSQKNRKSPVEDVTSGDRPSSSSPPLPSSSPSALPLSSASPTRPRRPRPQNQRHTPNPRCPGWSLRPPPISPS
ncbi:hypothetical protein NL108_018143 [Boleophthalmus pectinirostris]|nr:hypothetical protein NL108_018143 [Boleophthalmus pectinirostris]